MTLNAERAVRLANTLRGYGSDDTNRCCLIDLLTDARHWCDRNGTSFAELDKLAYQHYIAELIGEA